MREWEELWIDDRIRRVCKLMDEWESKVCQVVVGEYLTWRTNIRDTSIKAGMRTYLSYEIVI